MNEMTRPNVNSITPTSQSRQSTLFTLVVRQQPCKARLCSFKEKVDRRPIDPPPIIQLTGNQTDDDFLQNPYFFLYATLTDASGETDLHFVNGNRTTAGTVVQSLHKLKDVDNTDGGFFIFSDISVRLEGFYRLKFTLYEIEGPYVNRMCSSVSDIFQVYSPKSFPGMSESTFLTRSFSDQGVRIRIRKEPRSSSSNTSNCGKRRRKTTTSAVDDDYSDDDEYSSIHEQSTTTNFMELSPMPRSQQQQQQIQQPIQQQQPHGQPYFNGRSPSPLPEPSYMDQHSRYIETKTNFDIMRPTLPSPKEIFRSSPMSMQNILSSDSILQQQQHALFPSSNEDEQSSRLFTTRKLPLPLPTTTTTTTTNTTSQPHQPQQHTIHHHHQHIKNEHHMDNNNTTSWLPQTFSLPPTTTTSSSPSRRRA